MHDGIETRSKAAIFFSHVSGPLAVFNWLNVLVYLDVLVYIADVLVYIDGLISVMHSSKKR
jgi:hypothetical protein